jgi:hypothetical protein
MGGFLSALGAAAAGAGAQAGPWRDQQTEHMFRAWEQTKAHLLTSLKDLADTTTDRAIEDRARALHTKISGMAPGDKGQPKLIEEAQALHSFHPEVANVFAEPEPKQVPGMAAGVVPGRTIPDVQMPSSAAQPNTSPVQLTSPLQSLPDLSKLSTAQRHTYQPFYQDQAALLLDDARKQNEQQRLINAAKGFQGTPEFGLLPDLMRAQVAAQAAGLPELKVPSGGFTQQLKSRMTLGAKLPQGGQDVFGAAINPKGYYRVVGSPMGGDVFYPVDEKTMQLRPGAGGFMVAIDPSNPSITEQTDIPNSEELKNVLGTTAEGNKAFVRPYDYKRGKGPELVDTSLLPSFSTEYKQEYDPASGLNVMRPFTTTRGKITSKTSAAKPAGAGASSPASSSPASTPAPPHIAPLKNPSGAVQGEIAGMNSDLEMGRGLLQSLNATTTRLGPAAGRLKLAEIEKLGGVGASDADVQLYDQLKQFTRIEAFKSGGKALTATELQQITPLLPKLTDTLPTAVQHLKDALARYQTILNNRLKVMPRGEKMMMGLDETNSQDRRQYQGVWYRRDPKTREWVQE